MLKSYLELAVKVLLRKKFFTAISIFGVAITLAVITVLFAFGNAYISPQGPEHRSAHVLAIKRVQLTTTDESNTMSWYAGFRMLERHVLNLESPDLIGFYHEPRKGTVFLSSGVKIEPDVVLTDANYWRIIDHQFLAGSPLSAAAIAQGQLAAIVTRSQARELFDTEDATGERFELDGRTLEVVGVIEDVSPLSVHAYGEVFMPYTATPSSDWRDDWIGGFTALLFAEDPARLPAIREEFYAGVDRFVHDDPDAFQILQVTADTKLDYLARDFSSARFSRESPAGRFITGVLAVIFAFMLLPAVNLINLNVSRILERSGEIGVRKSFGASTRHLVAQFVVENLVLSVIGGIIGFGLGILALEAIEFSGLIPHAEFSVNLTVFGAALAMMMLFGLMSGIYPAWKMARMHPVTALRQSTR